MEGKFVSTSHRRESTQDPHASAFDKKLETEGWFVPTMPDLNTRNPFLGTYLIQNAIWWIEYASLGGLRIDTWPYSGKEYSAAWAKAIMTEYPNFNLVGEEWTSNPIITAYYQKGQKNRDGFVGELPSLMDFPLQNAVSEAMRGNDKDWGQGLNKVYEALANDLVYANPGNLVIFGDNHDMSRFYTQMKHDVDLLKMGMTILLTTRGIPQIYYGTEVLMANPNSSEHGEIRGDMVGGWAGDAKSAFTGQGLSTAEKDAQAFFKKILNWRKSNEVIHKGKLMHFGPVDGVYVYFRYSAKGKVMVIVNKNASAVDLSLDRFAEILPSGAHVRDVLSSTPSTFVLGKTLQVPAKKAWVLEVE
jgi:glycosidase